MTSEETERIAGLFDAHAERLYRLARRLAPGSADALDLVQDTFLKAARAPRSIPLGAQAEEAWLVRVLVNIQRDQWRQRAVRQRHQHRLESTGATDSERALIDGISVWQALGHLPPRRRAIVIMHELEGLPLADIAALLGITAITVRWHLSVGRRELARRLRQEGVLDEDHQGSFERRRPTPSRGGAN